MELRKFIATTIREYLNENYHFNNLKAYRGIGKNINKTYGGNDDGIGVFWTDNLTMAKWFAGLIDYNVNTDRYEDISTEGKILEKTLSFLNPYVINSDDEDYDSFQQYMGEINSFGGVIKYKSYLIKNGYDGIILKNNNTNYYYDGVYDIYIEF
jgi:hypothetical protein